MSVAGPKNRPAGLHSPERAHAGLSRPGAGPHRPQVTRSTPASCTLKSAASAATRTRPRRLTSCAGRTSRRSAGLERYVRCKDWRHGRGTPTATSTQILK